MKRYNRKRSISLLLFAALAMLLAACGSGSAKTDVPVADITDKVNEALGREDSLKAYDINFLGLVEKNQEQLGDYAIMLNVYGTNADEYGVLRHIDGSLSAQELKSVAEDYLQKRLSAWMDEYMPEEKPKLINAEVRVNGDYVMYCILSESDKETAFKVFNDALK